MAKTAVETKALTNWEDELAREAAQAANIEAAAASGNWFSTRGGILALNDAPMLGNQLACVVLASVFENAFYDTAFDPDAIAPPKCFALAAESDDLAPHASVVALGRQEHTACKGCEQNEYGSAVRNGKRAKGKACSNRRRLAVIPAGELDEYGRNFKPYTDEEQYSKGALAGIKVAPTSVKGYASYVTQLSATLRRPPWAVYTLVKLVPDPHTQIKLLFSPLGQVEGAYLPLLRGRLDEARAMISQPYNLEVEERPEPAALKPGKRKY